MDPISYHKKLKGKIEVVSRAEIKNKEDLSLAYTPGVAEACQAIVKDPEELYVLTRKNNLVAVVTDGSAVLGLGNIGPEASLPVMEGKCVLFKQFGGVDAVPIALKTQDPDEIVRAVELISPIFGGINLEDISAPRCFEIERRLQEKLDIPVFHDDQHGTAIVVLAGLMNAIQVVDKKMNDLVIAVNGAGAAGLAIVNLLLGVGVKDLLIVDSKGLIYEGRQGLEDEKLRLSKQTNKQKLSGGLKEAVQGADVFVGVSGPGLLSSEMVATMNDGSIVFALANPVPEIMPNLAKAAGAKVVATGRSDFPNQVNNVLAFPGIFKGLLGARINKVTMEMKIAAAKALAGMVEGPTAEKILPTPFEEGISDVVAKAVQSLK